VIPRYDTEVLVETILKIANQEKVHRLIDIGTGSGCIAITLKKFAPNIEIYAVDLSDGALEVAKRNALSHNVEITFIQSDIFSNVNQIEFDMVVSNPPYLTHTDEIAEEVKRYEPAMASILS
jgi:release factor glutamine methyltransferase